MPALAGAFALEVAFSKRAAAAGAARVLDDGQTARGEPFFVLERHVGRTLAKHAHARGGRFDLVTTLLVAERMLAVLVRLHAHGIVHGDISAENVFVTNEGGIRLLDYGRARPTSEAAPRVDVGATGSLITRMLGGDAAGALDGLPPRVLCLLEGAMDRFEDATTMRSAVAVLSDDVSNLTHD